MLLGGSHLGSVSSATRCGACGARCLLGSDRRCLPSCGQGMSTTDFPLNFLPRLCLVRSTPRRAWVSTRYCAPTAPCCEALRPVASAKHALNQMITAFFLFSPPHRDKLSAEPCDDQPRGCQAAGATGSGVPRTAGEAPARERQGKGGDERARGGVARTPACANNPEFHSLLCLFGGRCVFALPA